MSYAAIVVYDDPECAGAAEAFSVLAKRMPNAPAASQSAEVVLVPAGGAYSKTHGDALLDALRGLVHLRPQDIVVIALLKDANASVACQRVREICAETKPPIAECHIATHLANFGDVGLVVRNLVRRFHEAISKHGGGGAAGTVS